MQPRIVDIQQSVSRYYGLSMTDMVADRRSPKYSHPRQLAMYMARTLTNNTLPAIGRRFGDRDHSTVIHAIKCVEKRMRDDPDVDRAYRQIAFELKPGGNPDVAAALQFMCS